MGKNYAGMLPLNIQKEETFNGHMMLTFIATIMVKMLLGKWNEIFYWLPIEELIRSRQQEYYDAIG